MPEEKDAEEKPVEEIPVEVAEPVEVKAKEDNLVEAEPEAKPAEAEEQPK